MRCQVYAYKKISTATLQYQHLDIPSSNMKKLSKISLKI